MQGTELSAQGTQSNSAPILLSVEDVAALLSCSERHIRRLADAGRMPRPVRLSSLVRFRRSEIERWVQNGCPSLRGIGEDSK